MNEFVVELLRGWVFADLAKLYRGLFVTLSSPPDFSALSTAVLSARLHYALIRPIHGEICQFRDADRVTKVR